MRLEFFALTEEKKTILEAIWSAWLEIRNPLTELNFAEEANVHFPIYLFVSREIKCSFSQKQKYWIRALRWLSERCIKG